MNAEYSNIVTFLIAHNFAKGEVKEYLIIMAGGAFEKNRSIMFVKVHFYKGNPRKVEQVRKKRTIEKVPLYGRIKILP